MKRFFEKVSFLEFSKNYGEDKELYDNYLLPKRSTKSSAGYDFFAINDFVIKPGEIVKIPTGIKAKLLDDEVLLIMVRGSMGFKYNIRLCNQVGVVDADYYNNPSNEGHIFIALQNEGDKEFEVYKNDRFAQGIFMKYLITDDDSASDIRSGGFGSTNKKESD